MLLTIFCEKYVNTCWGDFLRWMGCTWCTWWCRSTAVPLQEFIGLSQLSLLGEIQSSSTSNPAGGVRCTGPGDKGVTVWHAIDTLEFNSLEPWMAQELGALLCPSTGEHSLTWFIPLLTVWCPLGDKQSIMNPRLWGGSGSKKLGAKRPLEVEWLATWYGELFLRWCPNKSAILLKGEEPLLKALQYKDKSCLIVSQKYLDKHLNVFLVRLTLQKRCYWCYFLRHWWKILQTSQVSYQNQPKWKVYGDF